MTYWRQLAAKSWAFNCHFHNLLQPPPLRGLTRMYYPYYPNWANLILHAIQVKSQKSEFSSLCLCLYSTYQFVQFVVWNSRSVTFPKVRWHGNSCMSSGSCTFISKENNNGATFTSSRMKDSWASIIEDTACGYHLYQGQEKYHLYQNNTVTKWGSTFQRFWKYFDFNPITNWKIKKNAAAPDSFKTRPWLRTTLLQLQRSSDSVGYSDNADEVGSYNYHLLLSVSNVCKQC